MERPATARGRDLAILRRSRDFDGAFEQGKRLRSDILLVIYLQRPDGRARVALLTAKGLGNAPRRNRQRRRLREACRALWPRLADQPADILLMALPPCEAAEFTTLERTMERLLTRAGLLAPDSPTHQDTAS